MMNIDSGLLFGPPCISRLYRCRGRRNNGSEAWENDVSAHLVPHVVQQHSVYCSVPANWCSLVYSYQWTDSALQRRAGRI